MPDSPTDKNEDVLVFHKPVMLFGRNVLEITCFRNSIICGICTGVVGGLACFLATSKTLFSTHVSFASLWIGTFAYWIPCRYRYETNVMASKQYREQLDKIRALK